jgi:hypothetical protein
MKTFPTFFAVIFSLLSGFCFKGAAQSASASTSVTLHLNGTSFTTNYGVQTNQIIDLAGYDWNDQPAVYGTFADGTQLVIYDSVDSYRNGASFSPIGETISGLTGITLSNYMAATNPPYEFIPAPGWATFKITTPPSTNACTLVVSNYVPADAIVIPASVTGNVEIILESSPDLVNWTAANPGIYGPSAATNRFFRVRAAVSP